MFCSKCGKEIPDSACFCSFCGTRIGNTDQSTAQPQKNNKVYIKFPVVPRQMFNNGCEVLYNGSVIAKCRQGETTSFICNKQVTVVIKMSGCFGKPSILVNPGDRLQVGLRGFGAVYVSKVDSLI